MHGAILYNIERQKLDTLAEIVFLTRYSLPSLKVHSQGRYSRIVSGEHFVEIHTNGQLLLQRPKCRAQQGRLQSCAGVIHPVLDQRFRPGEGNSPRLQKIQGPSVLSGITRPLDEAP